VRCRCSELDSHESVGASNAASAGSGGAGRGASAPTAPMAQPSPASAASRPGGFSAGLLLKRDAGMHREQQVGQTLRLLERLIWEDASLRNLLTRAGLQPEDVRATYVIAMTGSGTAIVEAVEGARTLRRYERRAAYAARGPAAC